MQKPLIFLYHRKIKGFDRFGEVRLIKNSLSTNVIRKKEQTKWVALLYVFCVHLM